MTSEAFEARASLVAELRAHAETRGTPPKLLLSRAANVIELLNTPSPAIGKTDPRANKWFDPECGEDGCQARVLRASADRAWQRVEAGDDRYRSLEADFMALQDKKTTLSRRLETALHDASRRNESVHKAERRAEAAEEQVARMRSALEATENALRSAKPIIEALTAQEYNVETWGLKSRLAAIEAALAGEQS